MLFKDDLGRPLAPAPAPTNLYRIDPQLHFPVGEVFRVPDEFNGKQRGTYYFRSIFSGRLRGPFISDTTAKLALHHDQDDGA
jgi:hypothetical protein